MTVNAELEKIAERLGLPFQAEIEDSRVETALLARLPLAFARGNLLLPLREEDGRLLVAVADPANLLVLDEVRGVFGMPVQGVVVPREALLEAVN
ncbi:MAG TPA: type II secretion system protein GspE, partial [Geobacteraceae bacterium]|nr:type II secretion system protein GspE [Geobacteraceae bacterium]